MKSIKIVTIISSLLLLFSCSNMSKGSEYIGTWKDEKRGDIIKISKQGKAFLIEGDRDIYTINLGIYILTEENFLKNDAIFSINAYIDNDSKKLVFSEFSDAGITKWTKISAN
jgi:hypothetical protein